jgi:hypothetical protein
MGMKIDHHNFPVLTICFMYYQKYGILIWGDLVSRLQMVSRNFLLVKSLI